MKPHFFTLLFVLCCTSFQEMRATPITRDEAVQRVREYFGEVIGKQQLTIVQNQSRLASHRLNQQTEAYYVLSRGANQGFIIASGDDKIVPVLGYTDNGDFDYEKIPQNMQEWLEDYEKQIKFIQQLPAKGLMTITSSHPEVPILLTCNWSQEYPFNNECPFDHNRDQCFTGCVATAMAQILYYHRERSVNAVTKAIPVYHTGEFYVAGIPKGAPIDWDNMIDNYPLAINFEFDENGGYREETIDFFTEEQKKAVAQLMHYCGVSVKMKYSSRGSSAMSSDVANAFKQYFGYYESTQYVSRSNCSSVEWDAMIYNDISQGFPVYLSGANADGGHAFVCDGYDGKGYYHINWGWGGYCDGFFLLNNLTPESQGIGGSYGGYNDRQEAVIGIVPASIMPIFFNNSITKRYCVGNWDTDEDNEMSYDEAAAVTNLGTVFAGTRITSFDEIRFFTSLTAISDDAFSKCSQLSSITIPDNVERIGQNAFLGCKSLTTVGLPSNNVSIGNNAFSGCKSITTLEIPESICEIGNGAFEGCTKLSSLTILTPEPSSIILGNDVFSGIDLNSATLYVLEGTKSFYESASQWNSFGVIKEIRKNSSENYDVAMELRKLLEIAHSKNINVEREQNVFDNLQSSEKEILQAQRTLRKKLGFISFADQKVKNIIQSLWDLNFDGELTKTELANINDCDIVGVFRNTDIISFEEFEFFTGLSCVPDSCFYNCNKLQVIKVPENVDWIGNDAFNGCSSLSRIELPSLTRFMSDGCFMGCTSLVEFYTYSPTPPNSHLMHPSRVEDVFGRIDLSKTTLYVPRGSKESYNDEALWNKFGEINEMRTVSLPTPIPLTLDERVYIYNIGKHQFINKGEAWGTQAVISKKGLVYKVRRTSTMPEGLYYLEAENIGTTNKILYRTDQDKKVGIGNKACFVDGTLTENAYWYIIQQDDGTYKIQVPQDSQDYVENQYLGFSKDMNSDYYLDSKGLYYNCVDDINRDERMSDWSFIRVEDYERKIENETLANVLGELICKAKEKNIDVTSEEMVYDEVESTIEEINNALLSIRNKLSYINFLDVNTKNAFIERWDLDEDEELSIEEAKAVVSIGQTFRNNKTLIELDELKYFTSIKEIEPNAFREAASLQSIYIPSNVTQIGASAFLQCNNLRYVAILNDKMVINSDMSAISVNAVLFVPANLKLNYQTNEYWKERGNDITEFTGQPVVTAIGSREYGLSTKFFKMRVEGAPILGEAEMYLNEDIVNTTPVGDYPIVVKMGNIRNHNVILKDGVFKVTPAPLTITANSYTRKVGEPNPQFEVKYSRFRNRETEDVLTVKPILTCSATIDSPAGEYEIKVSDAEASNYNFTYLPGILTIEDTDGIVDVNGGNSNLKETPTYDLLGRRVLTNNNKPGIYIVRGRKYVQR